MWDHEPVWIDAPRVNVVNPIGAGDVLTAALAAALERGVELVDAVREGVAAASAAVEHPVAGRFDPARMRALLAADVHTNVYRGLTPAHASSARASRKARSVALSVRRSASR